MKYLVWLLSLIVGLLAIVYIVAFTSVGNGLLQPTVEQKVKEATKLDSKVEVFSLSMNEFEIVLLLNEGNTVHVKGNYSLFSQAFDIAYRVKLEKLDTLKALTSTQLQGSFRTEGTVKGDMKFLTVEGKSDVASSDTSYHIELTDMNPTSVIAKINNAKLEELLYLGSQKQYASAIINLDMNFKDITPHKLDGDIVLKSQNGKLNTKVMKNDFNINIPKTNFAINLDAQLNNDNITYDYKLTSNLFNESSSGIVTPEPFQIDAIYGANINELALLKPIIGSDLRGALNINGKIKGTKDKLVVDGKSDLASSNTQFEAVLKDFKPTSVTATIKDLKLQKLLYMSNQPHYTDGTFSLNANLTDLSEGKLKGKVTTNIKNGLLDSKYMTKTYEFKSKMPRTTFNLATTSLLNKNMIDSKVDFNSNIANFDITSAKFNVDDSSLVSDFVAKIPNLDKLFFVTDQHMKGSITATGDVRKAKDLDLTVHTKVAGGNIDATLHNDDLLATLKGVGTMGILDMLLYPQVFESSLDANVEYNLAQSKGRISGNLSNGKFKRNQLFDLVKSFARLDMYRETFNGEVGANINKEKIVASLDLKSRQAAIKTKDTKLNTKTQIVDSKVDLKIKRNELSAKITGNINKPKVKLDTNEVLKKEIDKGLNKLFKKLF